MNMRRMMSNARQAAQLARAAGLPEEMAERVEVPEPPVAPQKGKYILGWLDAIAKNALIERLMRIPVDVEKTIGWSVTGTLLPDRDPGRAVSLQVNLSKQIQTHTIQFDGFDNSLSLGAVPARTAVPEAEILWQVNGVVIRRLVSVIDGLTISGAAQSVTVNIRDNTLVAGTLNPYRVGVTVVPGVRGSWSQPPFLRVNGVNAAGDTFQWMDGAAPTETLTWTIPANCGATSFMLMARLGGAAGADMTDTDLEIETRVSNTGDIGFYDANIRNKWMPLYGGTRTIRATNGNAARTISMGLVLGIDG